MRELGPDRLSDDGEGLVARDPGTGEEFTVPIDDRLKRIVALSEHRRRPGYRPRESTKSGDSIMQSALSPRDIQTRIRRGETVAEVADAAGVPTEQIDGFATPVLAERAYMAEQARATPLRRKHVGGAPVALGSIVDECLAAAGSPPDDAAWDAWRREDGRWAVIVTPTGEPSAHFIFDVKSRFVLPADDLAHGLVGDVAHPDESSDMALADAVRHQGDPVEGEGSVVTAAQVVAEDYATSAPVASLKEARDRRALEQMAHVEPASDDQHPDQLDFGDLDESRTEPEPELQPAPERAETSAPPVDDEPAAPAAEDKRKHERRRVPSWDEIMFGGRDG
ncbi:septation protein SepH [Aeromicrobium alkaliterrae]|uniref:Septation protein SepH n=1 Tax=Aeromicrobium alkaliterrae TaxID=302168 RepID=A0ABN2JIX2_9ACTN